MSFVPERKALRHIYQLHLHLHQNCEECPKTDPVKCDANASTGSERKVKPTAKNIHCATILTPDDFFLSPFSYLQSLNNFLGIEMFLNFGINC